jgi:steroid Delta-isomerase
VIEEITVDTKDTQSAALQAFVTYWHTLTPETVKRIGDVYTEDATFRDPFDDVRGLPAIQHIFSKMFERLHEPRFTITETIEQDGRAVLVWDFTFRIKTLKPELARKIHGTSLIRFAPDGRAQSHRDYWDAAGELYEQLPLIGALMRWMKKRNA